MLNPNPQYPSQSKPCVTVVMSAGQSRNPAKRGLESGIVARVAERSDIRVLSVPHIYDVSPRGETMSAMQAIETDLIVLSWLFDRATHWVLDRNGIRGQVGEVELKQETDEEEPGEEETVAEDRVIESQPRPARKVYCIDLRASNSVDDFVAEIDRIADLSRAELGTDDGAPLAPQSGDSPAAQTLTLEMLARYDNPTNDTYLGAPQPVAEDKAAENRATLFGSSGVQEIEEHPGRRWYPVIDFSRCTNCMECIDFCLFGVYGVDSLETIVVEQADNCRKGCPACSRVCPQNAIIFPQHKTPAIAGAPVDTGGLKIDLSKLFGAPEQDEDAIDVAARERDEQLILAGREAVGKDEGLQARLAQRKVDGKDGGAKSDELDSLLDELDSLDL
jgi:NAD-dependent dihydropyrimidine dehydrogenase PreA subunit